MAKNVPVGAQSTHPIHRISVIVPKNPFAPDVLQSKKHCMCALDVEKLMGWWPGSPHAPHRNAEKVINIQRSLDWKRVAQIASYLLQEEIVGAPEKIDRFFGKIYEPKKHEPGRQWPPKVSKVVGFQRSGFPTFSNVLIHVNGASFESIEDGPNETASLVFDEKNPKLNFAVIDGQHRINGAYLAVCILKQRSHDIKWEIPAEIFLDLDLADEAPRHQAQIFIDVNFYQKKVDKSLVADLYPTARGPRNALDGKERAQDIGRRLMLEIGPLVGLIQIPGIKFGAKDVVTLATLNGAIEDVLESLYVANIISLEAQSEFIAICLDAWLEASGRFQSPSEVREDGLDVSTVVYQGRVIVSVMTLIPVMILELRRVDLFNDHVKARSMLVAWLRSLAKRAGLLDGGIFLDKDEFKERRYLGAGGVGRFRDVLWAAAFGARQIKDFDEEAIADLAKKHRDKANEQLRTGLR